ncbi:restriction endonuclease subunit S domain-containing protein [Chitinasiproducens palmae]|uniref:hypothetical protein n=1 Tax=Chitinasiproducens palmae TaxID=1770053 RepID=UPI0011132DEB|nr:hypothetical protein [Chitinasiproducens palmae]
MNCQIISSLRVPVPPLGEQNKILEYIEAEAERLDALTGEAERAIELLTERRGALISGAVTGKIDVRRVAAEELAA